MMTTLKKIDAFLDSHQILRAILLLYGSLIFIAAFGKSLRVQDFRIYDLSFIQKIEFFRPEIFGGLGLIFLVLSITTLHARLLVPFIVSYLIWAVVSLIEIVGAIYFAVTSDTNIDVSIMAYSLANLGELMPVFAGAHGIMRFAAIFVPALLIAIFCTSLYLKMQGERRCPYLAANRHIYSLLPIAAVACLFISTLPNRYVDDRGHTQTFTYNILASIADAGETRSLVEKAEGPARFPISAALNIAPGVERRNIAVIILESTGMQVTSMIKPEWDLTPYLKELAGKSEFYTNVYTIVPHTSKAIQGILCGIEPSISHWMPEAGEGGLPTDCAARLLAAGGYRTAFFQTATETFEQRRGLVRNMGYTDFYSLESIANPEEYEVANYFGLEDDAILPLSREFLQNGEQPFFATYLTLTPHHGYDAPRRYGRKAYVEDETHNRYLNAVHYLDNFVRNLIDQYKQLGLYEDTLFVIVGDHGEAFGEHGRMQHDTVMYNEGLHVPLLIHDPRKAESMVLDETISVLDLLPNLFGRLGYTYIPDESRGFRYGERKGAPVFAHCARVKSCMAVIKDGYKLVHHFGIRSDELFRLDDDPYERANLIDDYPQLAEEMLAELISWRNDLLIQYRLYFVGE